MILFGDSVTENKLSHGGDMNKSIFASAIVSIAMLTACGSKDHNDSPAKKGQPVAMSEAAKTTADLENGAWVSKCASSSATLEQAPFGPYDSHQGPFQSSQTQLRFSGSSQPLMTITKNVYKSMDCTGDMFDSKVTEVLMYDVYGSGFNGNGNQGWLALRYRKRSNCCTLSAKPRRCEGRKRRHCEHLFGSNQRRLFSFQTR